MAQLERDLIAERVRNGLANAKAKGMTYREIAKIAGCSSGAVSAKIRAIKSEGNIPLLPEKTPVLIQQGTFKINHEAEYEIVRL